MAKKKVQIKTPVSENMNHALKTVIVVAVILLVVILITALVTGKIKLGTSGKVATHTVEFQTTEILAGQVFDQEEDNYLVLFYNKKEDSATMYEALLSSYGSKEEALTYYTVDMGNEFNNLYRADENMLDTEDASELKVKAPVLIEVSSKKIVRTVTDEDEIQEYFLNFGK